MLLLILLTSVFACTVIYCANFVTEPSVSPSPMPQVNIEAGSLNTEAAKKEQEYVHKIALNLKLNIKILLSSLVETQLVVNSHDLGN